MSKNSHSSINSEFDDYDKIILDTEHDFHKGHKFNNFIEDIDKYEENNKKRKREREIEGVKDKLHDIRKKNTANSLLLLKNSKKNGGTKNKKNKKTNKKSKNNTKKNRLIKK